MHLAMVVPVDSVAMVEPAVMGVTPKVLAWVVPGVMVASAGGFMEVVLADRVVRSGIVIRHWSSRTAPLPIIWPATAGLVVGVVPVAMAVMVVLICMGMEQAEMVAGQRITAGMVGLVAMVVRWAWSLVILWH
jgi:hypothetical protein